MVGSLNLVQTLLREKLFDRLDLWVHPVVLGVGKKVFDGARERHAPRTVCGADTVYLRRRTRRWHARDRGHERTRSRSRGRRLKSPIPYFDDSSPDGWFRKRAWRERRVSSLHPDTYTERRQAAAATSGWHTRFRTASSGHARNPGEVGRPLLVVATPQALRQIDGRTLFRSLPDVWLRRNRRLRRNLSTCPPHGSSSPAAGRRSIRVR